jgi:very-short-patch-repair endonuclease
VEHAGTHDRTMIKSRAELLVAESASTIGYRCRTGRYTRLLPGVYGIGIPTTLDRCEAAVVWSEAVLSHRTAAWLWGMLAEPDTIEATIPARSYRRTPDWLTLYRRDLAADAIAEAFGLPVGSPAQTLLDCAAVLPERDVARLVDDQIASGMPATDLFTLARGRRGSPALRGLLQHAAVNAASEPERLFARGLSERGVHMLGNHPVGPFTCDLVDERSRTIVEIDGREFHSAPDVFRQDRRRQNWLVKQRWFVLRYAAYDVFTTLDACVDEVAAVVRSRRRSRPA